MQRAMQASDEVRALLAAAAPDTVATPDDAGLTPLWHAAAHAQRQSVAYSAAPLGLRSPGGGVTATNEPNGFALLWWCSTLP